MMRSFGIFEIAIITVIVLVIVAVIALLTQTRQSKSQHTIHPTINMNPSMGGKMFCRSCGVLLSAENTSFVQGVNMIICPNCQTVYQMMENSK